MTDAPLEIPDKVRRNVESMGETGRTWLSDLPQRITELERRWSITVGRTSLGGTEAFVAEARTADGQDVVLKIAIAGLDPSRQELRTLRAAEGRGYAKLLRAD